MRSHSNSFTDYCVEMTKEFKTFTRATLDDALTLVRERFPAHAQEIARQALENPSLSDGMGSGAIGYRDGRPVALQLGMPRKVYLGQDQILGLVGGMTCKALKGCPLSVLLETIDRGCPLGGNVKISFGNTCCSSTSQMDEVNGAILGPASCTNFRYAVIRVIDFVQYVIRRKIFRMGIPHWDDALPVGNAWSRRVGDIEVKREFSFCTESLSSFWTRYLRGNKGLVASRTPEELAWIFNDRLVKSQCVLLGAYTRNECVGYIILTSPSASARRWCIGDMIALRNDAEIISVLLSSAKRFLRRCTPAFLFETIGFPMCIQDTIALHMPFKRKVNCNFFSYAFADQDWKDRYSKLINSSVSWFFGPYDGDMCMA